MAGHRYSMRDYQDSGAFPFHIGPATVDGRFAVHTHDFAELVVILDGTGRHVINGAPYDVGAGDVSVFNLGATHGFERARRLRMVNVMYAPSLLAPIGPDVRALAGFQALFVISPTAGADYRCMMRLDKKGLEQARGLLTRMSDEFSAKRPGSYTLIRALLTELVVLLSRRYSHGGVNVAGPEAALRLAATAGHMSATFREPHTVAQLADMTGISRRHFMRLFKQINGVSPLQYLLDLRLRHAAQLLRTTPMPITRVAFDSGFSDSNYFTRQFARRYGEAPREWRMRGRWAGGDASLPC